jgi:cytoskeleton protein RodZ
MTKFTQMAANEDDGGSRRRIHLREITGEEAPLETVGQDLRAARIRRGDDLAAVSRALKIRKDHLDALESDRLDDLPGKTYAIGFVRSYARYLGLDATELAERFKAEISGRSDDHPLPSSNLHEEEAKRLPYGGRVLAGVVILAVLYGVWHIFFATRDVAPPTPPPPTLARITDTPVPAAPAPAPPPAPMTPAGSDPTPAPEAAAPVPAPAPQNINPVATVSPVAGSSARPQASAAVPAVSGQVYGEQNRANARVALRARGATRITVTGPDNRLYINRDLVAGEVYYVPNLPGLRMALSNAGAVEVNLDGNPLGRVGSEEQVVGRVSLDPQSLTDRFNSR